MKNWTKVSKLLLIKILLNLDIKNYKGEIYDIPQIKFETKEKKEIKVDKIKNIELKDKEYLIKSENAELEDDKIIKSERNYQEPKKEKENKEMKIKEEKQEQNDDDTFKINTERELEQQIEKEKNQNNNINKSNIEGKNIYEDASIIKIKSLFESIKNFDQLKKEVYEMKKHYQYLNQLTIKSLEEKQKENLETFNQKFSEINKKFESLMGNNKDQDQDASVNENKKDNDNDNKNDIKSENENSENENKPKMMNLSEMNARLKTFEYSKANLTDLSQVNDDLEGKIKELSNKIDNIKLNLFGIDKDDKDIVTNKPDKKYKEERDNNTNNINAQRFNFLNKTDFEKFLKKSEEEHSKIWKEIDSLRLVVGDINDNFNNKASLDDLEQLKNIILDKTEELFLGQNKKIVNNSSAINILQDNFKKLLKLLSEKEQYGNIPSQNLYQFVKNKRSGSGGHSCASCESYIGDLKIEPKHVNWNQFPKKERDNAEILKKVHNGYSRLLQMINFDSGGKPSLVPYTSNVNSDTNISSNMDNNISQTKDKNEFNQSFYNKRLFSSKIKKMMKSNNKTVDLINLKKDEVSLHKKLPTIKTSKSIDNFQNLKQASNQTIHQKDIYFINPALYKVIPKREEKNG